MHAAAALSYVYLLLTGLAFWTPALFWLAIVLGGGYLSRLLHPWIGLVFTAAVVAMYVTWRRDMKTTPEDRAWRKAMRHYIRNEDDAGPARRPLQLRAEDAVLGDGRSAGWRCSFGPGAVVRRGDSVGASRPPLRGDPRAQRLGARHDRAASSSTSTWALPSCQAVSRQSSTGRCRRSGHVIIIRCGFRASGVIAPEIPELTCVEQPWSLEPARSRASKSASEALREAMSLPGWKDKRGPGLIGRRRCFFRAGSRATGARHRWAPVLFASALDSLIT